MSKARPPPTSAPLHPQSWSTHPWSCLHLDYAGVFPNHMFLYYSPLTPNGLVFSVNLATSKVTIQQLSCRVWYPSQTLSLKKEFFKSINPSMDWHKGSPSLGEKGLCLRELPSYCSFTTRTLHSTTLLSYYLDKTSSHSQIYSSQISQPAVVLIPT